MWGPYKEWQHQLLMCTVYMNFPHTMLRVSDFGKEAHDMNESHTTLCCKS